ncbi:DUF6443 domain-containing protein [Spongiimicrobium sp. 3-5]|uniref:Ig-like domain-containing protein n=1 Tax=Spongiimicrobium sp. 3-5 TaxID=3332596 RepID=UPI00397FFE0F
MKTNHKNINPVYSIFVTIFLFFCTGMSTAQQISGRSTVDEGSTNVYLLSGVTITSWNVSGAASWTTIGGGVRVTAGSSNFTISANFTQAPGFTAKFVTVNPTGPTPPSRPPTPSVTKFCDYTRLTRANPPSGVTYYWQSSSSGTSRSNASSSINRSTGTVYYLRARNNSSGLWSPIRSVSYTIDYAPSAPLSPTVTNNCGNTVLTRSNPNPTSNVTWYWQSSANGTSTSQSQLTKTLTSGTVYYLRAKTNGVNCWGPARTINYTVDNGPATPAAPTIQSSSCGNVVLARANPPSGVTYYWQTSATGTSRSNSSQTISLSSGSVRYLRGRNSNGCWSNASSRTYNISSPPATPTAPTVSANNCDNTVITRSNPPSGVTWYWQTSANGTSTSDSASTITRTNGTTQYLRARNSAGCWSTSSSSVSYDITYSPSAPLTPTIDAQNCGSTVLRRDNPNPTANVTWYWQNSSNGTSTGNSQPTISLNSGTVYYLRAKTNGTNCWGPARAINYTVDNGPAQPAAPTIQSNNCGSVVLARTNPPSGVTFYWQTSATGTSTSSASSTLTVSSGSTYYLRARNSNGCWSSASSRTYNINNPPATPAAPTVSANNCDNTVIARSNPPSGVTWYWQNSASGTDTINSDATITKINGTTQYLRARNSAGCWSDNASSVTYDIMYSPSAPLTPTIENFCGSTVLTRDNPNPTAPVTWYWQDTADGTSTANGDLTVTLTSGTVYYLRAKTDGTDCWGEPRIINYTVNQVPDLPTGSGVSQCGEGTFDLVASVGANGNTLRWYDVANGGTSLGTGETFTTPTISENTTYYVESYNSVTDCVSPTRHAIVATVTSGITWYLDADADGYAPINNGTVSSCDSPGPNYTQNVLPETDCNDDNQNINPTTIWYEDDDNDGLGDPNNPSSPSCTPPSGYVANDDDQCPMVTSSSNDCGGGPNDPLDQNYVYTRTYQAERTDATAFFTPNDSLIQTIGYFDGLGRPIQQIGIDHTPDKADVVTFMDYDDYGRVLQEFLPYPETDSDLGTYRLTAESKTMLYYDDVKYQTTNPYSEIAFEVSPLNRALKQAAPGNDWAMGNGHEIEFDYLANTSADDIKRYRVTLSFADNTYFPTLILDGDYAAGELTKTITYDENHTSGKNHSTEEFADKQGRIILKRTYANAQAHDTQYVYDDFGNLSYVLTPKMEPSTASLSEIISNMDALGYRYVYDQRNRIVVKQIPGKEEEHIVYNTLDQPIMTQDANQRLINEWLFTKYDQFGRVAYTGKAIDTSTRETIQGIVNDLTTPLWVVQGSEDNYGGTDIFYNNGAYPIDSLTEVLTINYYDNYNSARSGTATSVTSFGITSTSDVQGLATENKVKVLDVSTAHWITSVNYYDEKARPIYIYTENSYLSTVDLVEMKLDFAGRTLKSRIAHTRDGNTIVTIDNFTYDHVGRLLVQTQCIGDETLGYSCDGASGGSAPANLILDGNINDNQVATTSIVLQPNATVVPNAILSIDPNAIGSGSTEELIVLNTYDELGRLDEKKVGGIVDATDVLNSIGLQTVNFNYNVRDWLTGINDQDKYDNDLSIDANDLFAFKIDYNNTVAGETPLYNGNISKTLWRTNNDSPSLRSYAYSYDPLNRITSAIDDTADSRYSLTNIEYDKNGNIEKLRRNGHTDTGATAFGVMDDLTYAYAGNQLQSVSDTAESTGFSDVNSSGSDYTYDQNGNMISDTNKGITSISYNHLNLPAQVDFGSDNIQYVYSATGSKLRKIVSTGTTTDYAKGYMYVNNQLEFFGHPEGYVAPDGSGGYDYVYNYTDNVGNIRLSYTDANGDGNIDSSNEIIKENNFYPFGLKHKGYNEVVSSLGNSTAKKWQFNGVELEESFGINLYEMDLRRYDPAIARWTAIDPVVHYDFSTYNAFDNNPVFWTDPSGANSFEDRKRAKDNESENIWRDRFGPQYIAGNTGGSNDGCCPTSYRGSGVAIGDNVVNVLDEVVVTGTRNTGIAGDNVLGNAILFGSTLTRSTSTVLETFPTTFPEQKFADFSELDDIAKRMRGLESLNKYKGLSSSLTKGLAGLSIANDLTRYGLGLQSGARTTYHLTGTGIALGVGYLVSAPASLAATAAFIAGEKYYDSVQASKAFNASNRASIEIGGGNPDANIISVRAMENFISGGEFQ